MTKNQEESRIIELENKLSAANRNLLHLRRLCDRLKRRRIVLLNVIIDLDEVNKKLQKENKKLKEDKS